MREGGLNTAHFDDSDLVECADDDEITKQIEAKVSTKDRKGSKKRKKEAELVIDLPKTKKKGTAPVVD